MTPADFAQAVLSRLGLPTSANNVAALVSFQAHEGGHMANSAAYNPMNTTLKMPGSRVAPGFSSPPIQAYSSWDEGIEATAKTLAQKNMSAIFSSLSKSASADDTLRAVAKSPWGCYICANSPASNFQAYANKLFPVGKGMLDTGEHALKSLFAFRSTASKIGGVVIGVSILTGLGVLGYTLLKRKRETA
jgi:hypothetical protein